MNATRQFQRARSAILWAVVLPMLFLSTVPRGTMPAWTEAGLAMIYCGGHGPIVEVSGHHMADQPGVDHGAMHGQTANDHADLGGAQDICLWSLHMHSTGMAAVPAPIEYLASVGPAETPRASVTPKILVLERHYTARAPPILI